MSYPAHTPAASVCPERPYYFGRRVVASYAALEVADPAVPVLEVRDGDTMAVEFHSTRYGTLHRRVRFGSVEGYARRHGEDIAEAVRQETAKGGPLRWVNPLPASVSTMRSGKDFLFLLKDGQHIDFEEVRMIARVSRNGDVRLVRV